MNFKTILGLSCLSVGGTLAFFAFALTILFALFIEMFLPWGKDQAWDWMKGVQPPVVHVAPGGTAEPIPVDGAGPWCITRAYQETPAESHLNAGRVQGYVRDANGVPRAGVPVHAHWDGGEGITQVTNAEGRYEIILGPGAYRVSVNSEQSQSVVIRTDQRAYFGHYTFDVDFGRCAADPTPAPPHSVVLPPLKSVAPVPGK